MFAYLSRGECFIDVQIQTPREIEIKCIIAFKNKGK